MTGIGKEISVPKRTNPTRDSKSLQNELTVLAELRRGRYWARMAIGSRDYSRRFAISLYANSAYANALNALKRLEVPMTKQNIQDELTALQVLLAKI
jgi:hypothetical protein